MKIDPLTFIIMEVMAETVDQDIEDIEKNIKELKEKLDILKEHTWNIKVTFTGFIIMIMVLIWLNSTEESKLDLITQIHQMYNLTVINHYDNLNTISTKIENTQNLISILDNQINEALIKDSNNENVINAQNDFNKLKIKFNNISNDFNQFK
jgi:hypothetical protein